MSRITRDIWNENLHLVQRDLGFVSVARGDKEHDEVTQNETYKDKFPRKTVS